MSRVGDAIERLPYLFVSVDDSNEDKKLVEEVKLNEYSEELLNGSIQCSMLALNQICVGNSQDVIPENEQTVVTPLVVDGKTLISPHSLRGMV
ncbi:hypothetical protein JXR93_09550, partial [bacterium]|nr:hypothetical protein [bacterium]